MTETGKYKWANAHEWLKQSGLDLWGLIESFIDADQIQEHFESEMDADGFFDATIEKKI